LNVRRGDVPVELYERRVSFVTDQLRQAGVEVGRMGLSDGMPGGTGMSSNRVVLILAEETESLMPVTAGVQGVTAR